MAHDHLASLQIDELAARVRSALGPAYASEKRMFGGITFLRQGNMLCCASARGLMVRVGADAELRALSRPHAAPCLGTGRRMAGFIMVARPGIRDDSELRGWLSMAIDYVGRLRARTETGKARCTQATVLRKPKRGREPK